MATSTLIFALWGAATIFVLWVGFAKWVLRWWDQRKQPTVTTDPTDISPEEYLRAMTPTTTTPWPPEH